MTELNVDVSLLYERVVAAQSVGRNLTKAT